MKENSKKLEMKMAEVINNYLFNDNNIDELSENVLNLNNDYKEIIAERINKEIKDKVEEEYISEVIGKYKFLVYLVNRLKEKRRQDNIAKNVKNDVRYDNLVLEGKHTKKIIAIIHDNPGINHQDLADEIELKKDNLSKYISSIASQGLINKLKLGTNKKEVHYYLTELGDYAYQNIYALDQKYTKIVFKISIAEHEQPNNDFIETKVDTKDFSKLKKSIVGDYNKMGGYAC